MAHPPLPSAPPSIRIRGARTHNLVGLDLDLPRGAVIVFTGPSGSGKSSLALHLLHATGVRRALLGLPAGLRERIGLPPPPDVDLVEHLPPTRALGADQAAPSPATLASYLGVHDLLAGLLLREGVVHDPVDGRPLPIHRPTEVVAALTALPQGTRLVLRAPVRSGPPGELGGLLEEVARQGFLRVRIDGRELRLDDEGVPARGAAVEVVVDRLKNRPEVGPRLHEAVATAYAAGSGRLLVDVVSPGEPPAELAFADHPWHPERDLAQELPTLRQLQASLASCPTCAARPGSAPATCAACGGTGMPPLAANLQWRGRSLQALLQGPGRELQAFLEEGPELAIRAALLTRLGALRELGLDHLALSISLQHLALGAWSKLQLAQVLADEPEGLLVILDEPGLGLADEELQVVVDATRRLQDRGNTVLVVAHRPALIEAADEVVELGPGAGRAGGRVVFQGQVEALGQAPTATGQLLRDELRLAPPGPPSPRSLRLLGALHGVDLVAPRPGISLVLGPSGSGRRSLVLRTLGRALSVHLGLLSEAPLAHGSLDGIEGIERLRLLDRRPLGRNRRSCVATATGLWSHLRTLLAQTREARILGLSPGDFSFNTPGGRCESCQGTGHQDPDEPELSLACPVCGGRRFKDPVLRATWRGLSVHELLSAPVSEVLPLLSTNPKVSSVLAAMDAVGLGHLSLGRSSTTLSGGEAHRVRLAAELGRARGLAPSRRGAGALSDTVFVLDRPTAGLHRVDVVAVWEVLRDLASYGATVVAAEDDPWLAAGADQVLRLS